MAGSDTSIMDTYTKVQKENSIILANNKGMWVTQYQPITKKHIPVVVIQLLDIINGELGKRTLLFGIQGKRISRYN
jgi:hypothetical protein